METRATRFLYDHSPVFLQNVFASAYGWWKKRSRYGATFRKMEAFFADALTWPRSELEAYQNEKLREMIAHAYEHTAFYRRRFDEAGLGPDDIRTVADLPKLPLLEKDDVRRMGREMLSDAYDPNQLAAHPTSGSTGMPLMLYTGPDAVEVEYAFDWARCRPTVRRGEPYASFTGLEIVKPGCTRPPFWRDNWAANQRMYSVFHMSDANLAHYVRNLNRRPLVYMEGYPAPIYLIADYIERTGAEFSNYPRAVFTTAEELQPVYRETIERVLHTKVWDSYGQGELTAAITEYPCGHMHYDLDYGVVEFQEVGRSEGLVEAEVIGTCLYNYAWPLIRYRVGDLVLYDPDEPVGPDCVNQGHIIRRIFGRTGRYFLLPDGTRVTNISVIAKKCRNVITMQVLQEQAGAIEILVQKAPGFQPADEQQILDMFAAKLGTDLEMSVRAVEKPLLSKRGKFMSIISRRGDQGSASAESSRQA